MGMLRCGGQNRVDVKSKERTENGEITSEKED